VLSRLEAELHAYALETWLAPLSPCFEDDRLRLACPTPFHRDRVRDRFLPSIVRHTSDELGRAVPVELIVRPPVPGARIASPARPQAVAKDPAPTSELGAAAPGPPRSPHKVPSRRGEPEREVVNGTPSGGDSAKPTQTQLDYRFENFVVGPCNALAREASLAVARGSQERLNPLYLTADSGLGKTHLARAIADAARSRGRVLYTSAESFTNDFMNGIRNKRMEPFQRRYRGDYNVLVLEDVQFLRGKKATQLELFHTISQLIDRGGRVVLTADRLPRDIEKLDLRLCSQMSAGLVAELEMPDTLVRREILRAKAAAGGVKLPEDCRELLVETVRGSVRDLEGVLIQLVASASLLKRSIDLDLTRAALHKHTPTLPTREVEPHEIVETVAAFFKRPAEILAGKSRRREILWPRQLAMYLCQRYTDAPTSAIGRLLGREHTAVRNAIQTVERQMLEHAPRRYQVEALCRQIEAQRNKRA
jgi:chromosomal replication initiator protein